MKVSDFIRWLGTQDQDATVEVLVRELGAGWSGDVVRVTVFDPNLHAEYVDLRGNPHAIGAPHENARTLLLGVNDG